MVTLAVVHVGSAPDHKENPHLYRYQNGAQNFGQPNAQRTLGAPRYLGSATMVFPTRSLLLLSVITGVKAFVPPKPPVAPSTVLLMQREERVSSQGLTQFFGIFAAAAILSFPLEATARDGTLMSMFLD